MTGWLRHEYSDKLTGDLVAVEVIPEEDLQDHISSEDCECIPILEARGGTLVLIHNSFDGRESDRGH